MMIKLIKTACLLLIMVMVNNLQAQKLPTPLKVFEKDGIILKSYDFDRLEPYMKQKNDTLYVFNFWATWCLPCVEELPHFESINKKYANKKFKMTLVSLDFPKMVESRVIPFIKKKDLKAEVVLLVLAIMRS